MKKENKNVEFEQICEFLREMDKNFETKIFFEFLLQKKYKANKR